MSESFLVGLDGVFFGNDIIMKFTHFSFKNFKGIVDGKLDFSKNKGGKVFSLVGLNECGKTTILEAINFFAYKNEDLKALDLHNYEVDDIHNLIPINRRDNFNGAIIIEGGIELDDEDITEIKKEFKNHDIEVTRYENKIVFEQHHIFENSKHIKTNRIWNYKFWGKKGKSRKEHYLKNDEMLLVNDLIKKRMPSIIYFPNFLFEFPEKIYLDESSSEPKDKFYQNLIQDILDSLDNNTNIKDHLISRILSKSDQDKRNLNSLIGKMQKKLTEVIFKKWNQIFNKELSKTEIIIFPGNDQKGIYLEFNIKDDVDTYRINERSLGFRWFFVYILLTQFRSFRKKNNNVFFLFDEPASNLHPSAQMELLKSFETLPKVLYTTHSHYLINPKWLENTYVIKNEAIDYENETAYNAKNTNIKISKYRDFATNHKNQTSYYQPILEILDYKPANIDLIPNSVITEGKNDFYTLQYAKTILGASDFCVIPGTSSSNLETLISLYIGWNKNFIVLLDSDKEGEIQKNRYLEIFGRLLEGKIYTYKDINPQWKNIQLEKLFSDFDKIGIQNKKFSESKKYDKKIFNKSVQELLVCNENYDLEEATKENLQSIFLFVQTKLDMKNNAS